MKTAMMFADDNNKKRERNKEKNKMDNNQIATTNSLNNNYDMQQLMNITGSIGMSVQNMNNQMGILTTKLNNMSDDISGVKGDIEQLKLNEEVTTTQQETITESAKKRVLEVLNYDEFDRAKYFRTFIGRLYTDTRRNAGLGSKIARTKKGDFQRVIDYIEAWIPVNGCANLKQECDIRAENNRKAKELGYND